MRRLIWIPICFFALAIPVAVLAGNGGSGFDGVVHSIGHRYHAHATRVPFLGLISFVARRATHEGVADLHVAQFEHFTGSVDGEELNRMVVEKLGRGWDRIIRETSRSGNEQTLIFSRPEGRRMGLFIVSLDGNEMDVVQVSVNPDYVSQYVNDNMDNHAHHQHADHDRDSGNDVSD